MKLSKRADGTPYQPAKQRAPAPKPVKQPQIPTFPQLIGEMKIYNQKLEELSTYVKEPQKGQLKSLIEKNFPKESYDYTSAMFFKSWISYHTQDMYYWRNLTNDKRLHGKVAFLEGQLYKMPRLMKPFIKAYINIRDDYVLKGDGR